MGFLIVSTLSLFWYPYCPYCLGLLIVPYTHCPLDCHCIPTIACLLLLTFCVRLIVLYRTIGSVGISRVLCMPWSTSSFYHTGVLGQSLTLVIPALSISLVSQPLLAFALDSHPLCTSHTHFWCEYIILACCCSSICVRLGVHHPM